jgi:hypothetical protein
MENYLFELKIKELKSLKQKFVLTDNFVLIVEDKYPVVLGCKACYMVTPTSTQSGYTIPAGNLINYNEKYKEHSSVPGEVAINCWLCPVCSRLFRELLPSYEYMEVKDVSI